MSEDCKLEFVCRYSPCRIIEICKFRDYAPKQISENAPEPEQVSRLSRKERVLRFTTSKEDIRKARQILTQLAIEDKIGENQLKAINSTRGIHFENLSDSQKEQILSILQDVLKGKSQ